MDDLAEQIDKEAADDQANFLGDLFGFNLKDSEAENDKEETKLDSLGMPSTPMKPIGIKSLSEVLKELKEEGNVEKDDDELIEESNS